MTNPLSCPAAVTLRAVDITAPAFSGVYFVQQGRCGPIKIGWSKNVRSRIASLQTASPYQLRLLLVLSGEERDERRLHEWFFRERMSGEWFRPHGELDAFISDVVDRAEAEVSYAEGFDAGRRSTIFRHEKFNGVRERVDTLLTSLGGDL